MMKRTLFLFFFCAQSTVGQTTFHGNIARTGVYDSSGPKQLGGVKWTFETEGPIIGSPAEPFDQDYNQPINGVVLHFRVRGMDRSNPYLLILHGGPGSGSFDFYPWGALLEDKLNIVYLDQRGCGGSTHLKFADPKAPQPAEVAQYTFENLIRDAEGVRQFLKLERWYVLGHSFGGMLALEYVVAHQRNVIGYIYMDGLISVPLFTDNLLDRAEAFFRMQAETGDVTQKAAADEQLREIKRTRAMPTSLEKAFQAQTIRSRIPNFAGSNQTSLRAYGERVQEAGKKYHVVPSAQNAFEAVLALVHNEHNLFQSRDDRGLLAQVSVPTLILDGKNDHLIPPSMAEIVHSGIKGSQFVLIDDCGHAPYAEQPERTAAAVRTFIGTTSADGQERSFEAKVDQYIAPYLQMKDFGGVVLVARNGKILLKKGYGFASYELGVANTPETKFHIASVTKTFTAAAIVLLERQGRLSFEDHLSKFLPDFPGGDKIKISHLLLHTSGAPDFYSLPEYEELKTKPLTLAGWIALLKTKPLDFEPGTGNSYSNSGYTLLALIIERVSGQSYENFLSEEIFMPLGMTNTEVWRDDVVIMNRASGYEPWFGSPGVMNSPYYDKGVLTGSGSLCSTVNDLYLWYKAIRDGKLFKIDSPAYAYGWGPRKRFNRELIEQNGSDPGFAAKISAYLKDDLCVIVLSNIRTAAVDKIGEGLEAIALNEKYELPGVRRTAQVDPGLFNDYVGQYVVSPKMTITVKRDREHLYLKGTGGYSLPLEPLSDSKFFFQQMYVTIVFDRERDGRVLQLLWNGQYPIKKVDSSQQPAIQPVINGGAPVVSPDGSHIAFISNRAGNDDVFVISADGTGEMQLTHTPENKGSLGWTADGKRILFSVTTNDTSDLYSIDLGGKNQLKISSVPGRAPTLSPDGKRLLYMAGTWTATQLVVSAADGTNAHQITDGSSIAWNNHWSPDGKRIAFTSRNDPKAEVAVFVMNADGSGLRQVSHVSPEEGGAQWPVWSPDGRQFAIQVNSRTRKNTAHIWIVDVATGEAHKLATHDRPYLDETPSWFPYGKRIAFQSNRTGKMEVWVMNADGSNQHQLTGLQ